MRIPALKLTLLLALFVIMCGFALLPMQVAFAQDAPAVDTPTSEPPTPTPTNTPTETPTNTPTETPTDVPSATPTNTPTQPPAPITPTPAPVPIPEPVTTILFGTGLAALSAAVAARRRKK